MTKHDWIWIAIRVFGIYLLVQAVIAVPQLISSSYGIATYPVLPASYGDSAKLTQQLRSLLGHQFLEAVARLIVCGGVGIYLVRGGSWLFRILCPPDSGSK